jgi:hypothetical protein
MHIAPHSLITLKSEWKRCIRKWSWLNLCHCLSASQENYRRAMKQTLSGHRFKDDREVETVVTRWLITPDTDWHQQGIDVRPMM